MTLLSFISDESFLSEVEKVMDVAIRTKQVANQSFGRNVIDPFAAIFEMSGFGIDHDHWKEGEMVRQSQKTLQNHIGYFHQHILGHVQGWENLGVGSEVDLINTDKKIIAEIKNKYSTVTGGKLKDVYGELESLVMPKASRFKGFTAYFVNVIPKAAARFDTTFTPSDKASGTRCVENPRIRVIDGASFYHVVTGRENALSELFYVLPEAIQLVCARKLTDHSFGKKDIEKLSEYFVAAYGG